MEISRDGGGGWGAHLLGDRGEGNAARGGGEYLPPMRSDLLADYVPRQSSTGGGGISAAFEFC